MVVAHNGAVTQPENSARCVAPTDQVAPTAGSKRLDDAESHVVESGLIHPAKRLETHTSHATSPPAVDNDVAKVRHVTEPTSPVMSQGLEPSVLDLELGALEIPGDRGPQSRASPSDIAVSQGSNTSALDRELGAIEIPGDRGPQSQDSPNATALSEASHVSPSQSPHRYVLVPETPQHQTKVPLVHSGTRVVIPESPCAEVDDHEAYRRVAIEDRIMTASGVVCYGRGSAHAPSSSALPESTPIDSADLRLSETQALPQYQQAVEEQTVCGADALLDSSQQVLDVDSSTEPGT